MSDIEVQIGDAVGAAQTDLGGTAAPVRSFDDALGGMDQAQHPAFVNFVVTELDQTQAEMEKKRTQLIKWRRQRLARPENETKNDPWPNASNVVPPMAAMLTNTVYGLVKKMVTSVRPRMVCTPANDTPEDKLRADAIEWMFNFLNDSPLHINLAQTVDEDVYMDAPSLGVQFIDVPWGEQKWTTQIGGAVDEKTVYSGPLPKTYRIEDVRYRTGFSSIAQVPAFMMASRFSRSELLANVANGFFDKAAADLVIQAADQNYDPVLLDDKKNVGMAPGLGGPEEANIYTIWKVYASWDQGDGVPREVIGYVHKETETLLRVEGNQLGKRTVVAIRYMRMPGDIGGVGIGHYCELLQDEIETLHNMGIDSAHISALQMFAVRRGSGLRTGERMKPGKMWDLADPQNDFRVITFPNVLEATMPRETMAWQYAQQVIGMPDALRGMPDQVAKSRVSGIVQENNIQQAGGIFDSITKSIRDGYSELYMFELLQCVANGQFTQGLIALAPEKYQPALSEVFSMDVKLIPYSFSFTLKTTPVDETKEAQKQNIMLQWQLSTQYAQQIMSYSAMLSQPNVPPLIQNAVAQLVEGLNSMYKKILELMNVENTDEYVVVNQQLAMMVEQMKQGGALNAFGTGAQIGGGPAPLGLSAPGGMGAGAPMAGGPPQGAVGTPAQ